MRIIYTANARIPSEKAHPYQILQMCEAFAQVGADVRLLHARRKNPPELQTDDIWGFYSLERNFEWEIIPCLDIYPFGERLPARLRPAWWQFAALLQMLTYNLALALRFRREDWSQSVVYSRDPITLAMLAALWPRGAWRLYLEAHTFPATCVGLALRRWLVGRLDGVIVITNHLKARYQELGTPDERLLVARDGYREARFAIEGDQATWRARLGWPLDAFIVGFVGRFHLMGMAKGLVELADAVARLAEDDRARPVRLALVGGPDEVVSDLQARLVARGLPPGVILYPGQVPAGAVPGYLCAFDVCALPSPWTEFFAYYVSPLKLFEYMASANPIVASDLPAIAEVIQHERNGLLVPPGDSGALASALRRLRDDAGLCKRLATQAASDARGYTWEARARRIIGFIERQGLRATGSRRST
jgi:glycosyltransferase involved in cell wall biosynthesis